MIRLKLPVSEEALALNFHQSFDIKPTKGIIFNTVPVFISKENYSVTTTGLPTLNTDAGNQHSAPHFVETLKLLGTTKSGILELIVLANEQLAFYHNCDNRRIVDAVTFERARERCINVQWRCVACVSSIWDGFRRSTY